MAYDNIEIQYDLEVPMRDGAVLRADLFRPATDQPLPTLVVRTPYNKSTQRTFHYLQPLRVAREGYAVLFQDCRGIAQSEGDFSPFRNEGRDGYDTIEWAAEQSWSNGKIGMYGLSYLGLVQWMAAGEQPPHLKALFPASAPASARNMFFRKGVFQLQAAQYWSTLMNLHGAVRKLSPAQLLEYAPEISAVCDNLVEHASHLPLAEWPFQKKTDFSKFYLDWLANPDHSEFWRDLDFIDPGKITVPSYHLAGWYDICLDMGALNSYSAVKEQGGSEAAQRDIKMILGPWIHEGYLFEFGGEINFGMVASGDAIDLVGIHLRWFDYWLKDIDTGIMDEPPVKLFVMGENVWRHENEWPLARTQYRPYYLHGEGVLSEENPGEQLPDHYVYDPANPVPTNGGSILSPGRGAGPRDQRLIEARDDVLVYSTAPLEQDTEVTGPISMRLFAASSAVDTDFTAKLVDVWPDGRALNLTDGIVRARYRDSDETPDFLEPGRVYEFDIDLFATSNLFKAGHQIRIEISSSNFPKYDRNLNTGEAIGQSEAMLCAEQTIFHDRERPSCVILPLIPR